MQRIQNIVLAVVLALALYGCLLLRDAMASATADAAATRARIEALPVATVELVLPTAQNVKLECVQGVTYYTRYGHQWAVALDRNTRVVHCKGV
jgi:hypothetical protein